MRGIITIRAYDFPYAIIKRFSNGKLMEFPKWCLCVGVERSRNYVAIALRQLRTFRQLRRDKECRIT